LRKIQCSLRSINEIKHMKIENINTLGELKQSGYRSKSIKDELRDNLRTKIKSGKPVLMGYTDLKIPSYPN